MARKVRIVWPKASTDVDPDMQRYAALPTTMGETRFQEIVEQVARGYGWLVHHETDSRKSPKGLPDVIAVSPPADTVILWLGELKSKTGVLTDEQEEWNRRLMTVTHILVTVTRPADWPSVLEFLAEPESLTGKGVPSG